MSLSDTAFIFVLALIIFGPKKLPEIGRQIGRLVGEFRRASNEFKFQIDEELRLIEREDEKPNIPVADAMDVPTIAPTSAQESLPVIAAAVGTQPRGVLYDGRQEIEEEAEENVADVSPSQPDDSSPAPAISALESAGSSVEVEATRG